MYADSFSRQKGQFGTTDTTTATTTKLPMSRKVTWDGLKLPFRWYSLEFKGVFETKLLANDCERQSVMRHVDLKMRDVDAA